MSRRHSPRGFVLPTTLLVMTLLTVMLTAAFVLVSAEHRASQNSLAATRALALAQAGLQTYLSRPTTLDSTSTYDSTRIAFSGGYTDIVSRRMVPQTTSSSLWVVRADGYVTAATLSGTPQAKRTIAALANLNPGRLYVRAALVAANPTVVTGPNWIPNPVDGDDACGGQDTVGLTTVAGDYTASPGPGPGEGIEALASRAAVIDSTHVDWAAVRAGNFTADYTVTTGSWPSPPGGYPVYHATADITVPAGARSGILVADNDVQLSIGTFWSGVIIAGGRIQSPTSWFWYVRGSTFTGLNNLITPGTADTNRLERTWLGVRYSSCDVNSVRQALSGLSPLWGGWIDTWATY